MNVNKRKLEWPEHSSWWDRNEKKVKIILWSIMFLLFISARKLLILGIVNSAIAKIWCTFFFLNLFLLSFLEY